VIDRLVVATKNPDKVVEMTEILGRVLPEVALVGGLDWPEVDEIGDTLEDNALLKARAVLAATGIAALADDTGLEVAALGGAPGVSSARFAGPAASYEDNRAELLRRLDGVIDRRARFRTVVVLAEPGGGETLAQGVIGGMITETARGRGGFGYDPLFEIGGRTLAEMDEAEKNRLSHRANAISALADLLRRSGGVDGRQ
jgi:XTP/dITP diphosphohydrolase